MEFLIDMSTVRGVKLTRDARRVSLNSSMQVWTRRMSSGNTLTATAEFESRLSRSRTRINIHAQEVLE